MHIYTYIYVYIFIYIHTLARADIVVNIHIYIHIYTYAYKECAQVHRDTDRNASSEFVPKDQPSERERARMNRSEREAGG